MSVGHILDTLSALDEAHPMSRARANEAEAIRQRQLAAAEALMALPIPRDLRLSLRAFHDSLEPAIIEHERNPA